jgi:hypothetical protein
MTKTPTQSPNRRFVSKPGLTQAGPRRTASDAGPAVGGHRNRGDVTPPALRLSDQHSVEGATGTLTAGAAGATSAPPISATAKRNGKTREMVARLNKDRQYARAWIVWLHLMYGRDILDLGRSTFGTDEGERPIAKTLEMWLDCCSVEPGSARGTLSKSHQQPMIGIGSPMQGP